ncbi:LuxR C-terminal-related transcriptional regulator [Thiorhodovibrio frisius]|uniref:Response regulator containing a CheY-like receiver domain and an HTH DNA-binding domain n=1 Tax=Thiorhodovibrio frisius TaxID=631362 RepID=H8YYA1_9GAMM|nr:LuxR C-terminal-related transcriptional regulator [Thiorhodovibrio frisius]EIC23427.1 response regulator containing a CheY-like receiver domain and an HTH DNA-binding domain [Thiorhodovibrio frisius]WPL23491.1 Transcriptional regulatory protein LiaR [Thiorhodovibrio frisius]
MSKSSSAHGENGAPRALALTPRQRQILGLMCKGKVNKEIANELDISLGTVKQHIAALFKRMQVQNRSMAVAQGKDMFDDSAARDSGSAVAGADWADDIMLIRRPCVVLAVRISRTLNANGQAQVRELVKALAAEMGAFHLPGGDEINILLFGVRRPSVWDAIKALLLLQQLHKQALGQGLCDTGAMAAALDGGMAVISINARGRWSGDTVATPVISMTRRLLGNCPGGMLTLGVNARHLLESLHAFNGKAAGSRLPLGALNKAFAADLGSVPGELLYPNQAGELETPSGKLRQLVGPLGSGKSHLCRYLVARARMQGRLTRYLRLMPAAPAAGFWDADTGRPVSVEDAIQALDAPPGPGLNILVIDDIDLLDSQEARQDLMDRLQPALAQGCLVILTARTQILKDAESIRVQGIDSDDLEGFLLSCRPHLGGDENNTASRAENQDHTVLLELTEGLPLFLLELSKNSHHSITLPVLLAIATELDQHPLDWRVLRILVQSTEEPTPSRIQSLTGLPLTDVDQSVRVAVDAGLLHLAGTDQLIRFSKPLMQRGIASILI